MPSRACRSQRSLSYCLVGPARLQGLLSSIACAWVEVMVLLLSPLFFRAGRCCGPCYSCSPLCGPLALVRDRPGSSSGAEHRELSQSVARLSEDQRCGTVVACSNESLPAMRPMRLATPAMGKAAQAFLPSAGWHKPFSAGWHSLFCCKGTNPLQQFEPFESFDNREYFGNIWMSHPADASFHPERARLQ